MIRILHFADAHIDMANYGRHDPTSGLPLRVLDFLKSLDTIVDTAIEEKVDLVIFAGDAYKDRSPAPTFQREWGRRIMRLSQAGILTLLLVGNHDLSPALGRAHALEEFNTLQVPHVRVLDKPVFLTPHDLEGLPLQVLAIPYIARSGLIAQLGISGTESGGVYEAMEERLLALVDSWLGEADPALPVVMTAHCSVQGAKWGMERSVMLGGDLTLSGGFVRDPRLDYVALGHIHKPQDLNPDAHPPVIYPGSIERVDFGEAAEDRFFVIAEVERGQTRVDWRQLTGVRPFIDSFLRLEGEQPPDGLTNRLRAALPSQDELAEAIVRFTLEYPRAWDALIDETALRDYAARAFEFRLVKRPQMEARLRLPDDQAVTSFTPLQLLGLFWRAEHVGEDEIEVLLEMARDVLVPSDPDVLS
ncbi:MAG: metallophosphoesterase family protein [Anaerolineales bacterium]